MKNLEQETEVGKRENLFLKWEFYAISFEEIMGRVEKYEWQEINIICGNTTYHIPRAIYNTIKTTGDHPQCMVFPMEQAVERKSMKPKNRKGTKFTKRKQHLF